MFTIEENLQNNGKIFHNLSNIFVDRLSKKILKELQGNGDLTQSQLAKLVDSTSSTCMRRIQKLRKDGYLKKRVYLTDAAKLGRGLRAIITVTTRNQDLSLRRQFTKRLSKEPSICCAYGVTGEVDAVLIGNFSSMEEFQSVCDRLFDKDSNVLRYTSSFAVEIYKEETSIPIDSLP